jgi:hypothetical protein
MTLRSVATFAVVAAVLTIPVAAGDWTNNGGTPRRDGLSSETGPDAATILWSGGRPSIIAWNPAIEGSRVFLVRQTGFPPGGEPNGSPVVAQDLDTGAELWAKNVPFQTNDWTTWIAGVNQGKVYASRSGNGASVSQILYALDAATGNVVWTSQGLVDAGPYDGVVFAPNGDLIVGDFNQLWRIRASDGTTAWVSSRVCSVSSSCGGCVYGSAVYVADAVPGGHAIKRYDLATGAFQYQGPTMPGFTLQNTPMVGRDGTIYLSRTQNNVATDFFYAFADDGAQITEKWHVPAAWSTESEFAIGPDGTVYHLAPGSVIDRLDPATGATMDTSMPITGTGSSQPHLAIDALGNVYASNGNFSDGTLYAFRADLSFRWSVPVTNINIGGPAIGRDGTLVVAGVGTDVRAYRTPRFPTLCAGDGSAGNTCPCANAGSEHHGCANSRPLSLGAALVGAGETNPDSVVLSTAGMPPSSFHVYFQGSSPIPAAVLYGDGLRCTGGQLLRLSYKTASDGASSYPVGADPSITARCAALGFPIPPGATRIYQVQYRDPDPAFCPMPTGSTFNATNAVLITW